LNRTKTFLSIDVRLLKLSYTVVERIQKTYLGGVIDSPFVVIIPVVIKLIRQVEAEPKKNSRLVKKKKNKEHMYHENK
jgi:hypothetical protein